MSVCVSAPGKLFLLGEYAVLEGAPALLSAVDRRVCVTVAQSSSWTISAPDLGIDTLPLADGGALPAGLAPATRRRLSVYQAVHATLAEYGALPDPPQAITTHSSAFSHAGHKLGLGASAAITASLIQALSRAADRQMDRNTVCRIAIAAHRRAQHGAGSGADVATSVYGGIIEFQADSLRATHAWPAGMTGMAVITGDGASTTDLVGRVAAYAQRAPDRYAADMATLAALATQAPAALTDTDAFLQLVDDYFQALQQLGTHADAGIVLPRHRELAALVARHGGAFKTTGAGGGDLGLAFVHNGAPARELHAALTAAGARTVALNFGTSGLRLGE